jgi:hypothetical protein
MDKFIGKIIEAEYDENDKILYLKYKSKGIAYWWFSIYLNRKYTQNNTYTVKDDNGRGSIPYFENYKLYYGKKRGAEILDIANTDKEELNLITNDLKNLIAGQFFVPLENLKTLFTYPKEFKIIFKTLLKYIEDYNNDIKYKAITIVKLLNKLKKYTKGCKWYVNLDRRGNLTNFMQLVEFNNKYKFGTIIKYYSLKEVNKLLNKNYTIKYR